MSDVTLDPYLFFKGNCREAMEFYKNIFGGDLTIQTYADVKAPAPEGLKDDSIMHAMLDGGHIKLMASDTAMASDKAAKISLSLGGSDETTLTNMFNGLCQDVTPFQALKKEFWGDIFGSVTDKYNLEWMVNITQPAEQG